MRSFRPLVVLPLLAAAPRASADLPGFFTDPDLAFEGFGLATEEGGEAIVTVTLVDPPAGPVTVDLTTSSGEVVVAALDPSPIQPGDPDLSRAFRVTGQDDSVEDGDQEVDLVATATGLDDATLTIENLDDDTTFVYESPFETCDGPTVPDVYDGRLIGLLYDAEGLQKVVDELKLDDPGFGVDHLDEGTYDDRIFFERSDERYVSFRTLHVIVPSTPYRTMDTGEIAAAQRHYALAAHRIHTASRGMVELQFDQVVVDDMEADGSWFADTNPLVPVESLSFAGYGPLGAWLGFRGYDPKGYDIVSVSVAVDSYVKSVGTLDIVRDTGGAAAYAVKPPVADPLDNTSTWDNGVTWTTVQWLEPETLASDTYLSDVFVHEMNHDLEWMLEVAWYPEFRNADDPWWRLTYPEKGDIDVLNMFWARPMTNLLLLPFGEQKTRRPTRIVEMTCTDAGYQEQWVRCDHGVTCDPGCRCVRPEEAGGR